jgi:hypothetical protein
MGRPFQSPFAKPPGKGLSSSMVNVLWGLTNFILAYLLLLRVGHFDLRSLSCIAPFAIGALLISLQLAKHFGEFHGVGTWMQRVAQDWIVLTQLTHHDATALGIVTGLQFAP